MQPELEERLLRDSRAARPEHDPEAMRRGIAELLARGERAARRRRRPLVALLAAAVVLAAALAAVAAERRQQVVGPSATPASALVDRTFSCRTVPGMPLRIQVSPLRRIFGGPGNPMEPPAFLAVGGGSPQVTWPFVLVRAAHFRHAGWQSSVAFGAPGVQFAPARCSQVRTTVPLARAGLPGPAIHHERTLNCRLSGRVLVRVRARLSEPTRWGRVNPTYTGVQRRVLDATMVVRLQSGAPIAFGRLQESGIALWSADRCH